MGETVNAVRNALWVPFHDGADQDRLVLPHCIATDRAFWPPSRMSPYVTGGSVDWRQVSPDGRLVARVVYRRGFQQAFEPLLPYGVALVELHCGIRLQAHLYRPDDSASPREGERVTVGFAALIDGGKPVLTIKGREP